MERTEMQTYEVTIHLTDNGRNLSILWVAPSPASAVTDVRRILHEIGVKAGREYDPDKIKVTACTVEAA
jgi:hypothetical protein